MFVSVWFRSPDTRLLKKRNFPSKQSIDNLRANLEFPHTETFMDTIKKDSPQFYGCFLGVQELLQ